MPDVIDPVLAAAFTHWRRLNSEYDALRRRVVAACGYDSPELAALDRLPRPEPPPEVAAGVPWLSVDL